jgi:hypothetical protein
MEARDKPIQPAPKTTVQPRKTIKIGKPGYRASKLYDPEAHQRHLLFQVRGPCGTFLFAIVEKGRHVLVSLPTSYGACGISCTPLLPSLRSHPNNRWFGRTLSGMSANEQLPGTSKRAALLHTGPPSRQTLDIAMDVHPPVVVAGD